MALTGASAIRPDGPLAISERHMAPVLSLWRGAKTSPCVSMVGLEASDPLHSCRPHMDVIRAVEPMAGLEKVNTGIVPALGYHCRKVTLEAS